MPTAVRLLDSTRRHWINEPVTVTEAEPATTVLNAADDFDGRTVFYLGRFADTVPQEAAAAAAARAAPAAEAA